MNRSLDFIVHGVALDIGRPPQRHEFERHARLLQSEQFLGDESFRKTRIAFEDDDGLFPL